MNTANDVVKIRFLKEGAYPGLSRWTLNEITCIFIRKRKEVTLKEKRRRQWEHRDRDQNDVTISQVTTGATRTGKNQRTDFL